MTDERFTPESTAMLLIDHQVGTMGFVGSIPRDELTTNTLMLARTAVALRIPLVLTSSQEDGMQGPLLPGLAEIAPDAFAARIRRRGHIDAFTDEAFAAAVERTGRSHLVIAGVTNDVCTVFPTLTALRSGYRVQVVADAGGSPTAMSDDLSLRRMQSAGAVVSSTNSIMAELAHDWTSAHGTRVMAIIAERLTPAGGAAAVPR
jgi:nicotinamidase-related amidase